MMEVTASPTSQEARDVRPLAPRPLLRRRVHAAARRPRPRAARPAAAPPSPSGRRAGPRHRAVSAARVVALDDLPRVADPDPSQPAWLPVRAPLGLGAFGVNAWTAARAGQHCVERHDEGDDDGSAAGRHEELSLALRGPARFVVAGESHAAPAGTLVAVLDPGAVREALAEEDGTVVLAVGARR